MRLVTHGANRFQVFAVLMGICVAACTGRTVAGEAAPATPEPASDGSIRVVLEPVSVVHSVLSVSWAVKGHEGAFKKEPSSAEGKAPSKVRRGRFDLRIPGQSPIPFLWDYAGDRLYLDLNRNEDLTDDPDGVLKTIASRSISRDYRMATFTNVSLSFEAEGVRQSWLADLNLTEFRNDLNAFASVRTFWSGRAALAGGDWQVGVVNTGPANPVSKGVGDLLLRPWDQRDKPFMVHDGLLHAFPVAKGKLFVQTTAYDVKASYAGEGERLVCRLEFREERPALGELKITGEHIQRLLLRGESYTAVLDQPASSVRLPVGQYESYGIRLGNKEGVAYVDRLNHTEAHVIVEAGKPSTLAAGGPLTNKVTVARRGDRLALSYRLVGVGGTAYTLGDQSRSQPPKFAVYKEGRQIASGDFQYG